MCPVNLRARLAQSIYDYLDVGKSPRPGDCIFVLAGKHERKSYGLKMWRFGYAPQLILSIGRFEWRQFRELSLESDGGLKEMVEQTTPKKRHFLVRLDRQEAFCTMIQTGLLGTRSEVRALAAYLRDMPIRSLLVLSSPAHLRRVAIVFHRAFRKRGIHLTFVSVPENPSFASSADRAEIWSELCKYLLYRFLFW